MITLELKSEKRDILGKKVKTLRNKGLIPAVVYGGKEGNIPLVLNLKEFKKVFKNAGETALIKLFIDNTKLSDDDTASDMINGRSGRGQISGWKNVLIYDISRNPVTDEINHVDLREVRMDEKITAKIPVIFIGDSPAVADLGGVLVKAMQEIEVKALPSDLPHQIEVDISSLKTFDDNITVSDIKLPKGVEILDNVSSSLASVVPPRSEAEIEALSGQVEEKIEDVAVETEEKTAERAKEKEEETK